MPKNTDKKGKRKVTPNDSEPEAPKEKKPKTARKHKPVEDEIAKSKQLATKLKTSARKVRKNSKYPEPRMSANGRMMPSLAELERMFEGSDDEENPLDVSPSPERCKTPDQPIIPSPKKILTPKTIQKISNMVLESISTLLDVATIPDDAPPLPVVPQEHKRKKNGTPYIVGCKERDKIPDAPSNTVIGRAWDKYGVDYNFKQEKVDDEECSKKKGGGSISKSIFNPKSDEIAAMLESSEILSDGSVDSNKTVTYEYSPLSPKLRTFSPLPSTSKDKETILMNDLRFNETLLGDSISNDSTQSEVEVIELPCETIMVDDDAAEEVDTNHMKVMEIEITEVSYHPPTFDSFIEDDLYSSVVIDLDQTYNNDDCEIIDVDEVLAENKNIIDKYKKESYTKSVTHVQLDTSTQPNIVQPKEEPIIVNKDEHNAVNSSPSTRDRIASIVTDYFRQKSTNSHNVLDQVHTPQNTNITETIDLSDSSTDPSMFRDMMDSFTKTFMSWTKGYLSNHTSSPRKRKLPVVVDTIDLDDSNIRSRNSINDNSVTFVGSATSTSRHDKESFNLRNTPNDNSVIIVSNVNVNMTPQNVEKKKKLKKKKNDTLACVATPVMSTPNAVACSTPPGRTIGDCPICMENLSNNAIASTICGHIFCMTCIQAAIKASGKRCPTCRKTLRGVGYHQLFL